MDLRDRLCSITNKQNWDELLQVLNPKMFHNEQHGNKMDRRIIASLAQLLTEPELHLPHKVKGLILKCLGNSCISPSGYPHKSIDTTSPNIYNKIYRALSNDNVEFSDEKTLSQTVSKYPETFFPYDGVVEWIKNYLTHLDPCVTTDINQLEMMRICFAFLCNVMTMYVDRPKNIYDPELRCTVVKLLKVCGEIREAIPLVRAICCFLANIMNTIDEFFDQNDYPDVIRGLLKADKLGIGSANATLMMLMSIPQCLCNNYETLDADEKLYLLKIIHENVKESVYENGENHSLPADDAVNFLVNHFKQKSNAILKTVDTYVNDMEPVEVYILLDILCALTSAEWQNYPTLRTDTSLLIDAIYLLKAIHMAGKGSNNYFTSIQRLSDMTSTAQDNENLSGSSGNTIQDHPAFGFKASLIRLIGNLVYHNPQNQNMVREVDGIPLLLDCCNIDARNPLIMQWAIFAIRNLCENNPDNQQLIRGTQKTGIIDNEIIETIGITLNESKEGEVIGIVPLIPRDT